MCRATSPIETTGCGDKSLMVVRTQTYGFDDLRRFMLRLGFVERTKGSHHIFRRQGVRELVNLQREGSHTKPYQVRQVRRVVVKYSLE